MLEGEGVVAPSQMNSQAGQTFVLVACAGMQHSVISAAAPYGLGLQEKLLSEHLNELKYSCHAVGKVQKA